MAVVNITRDEFLQDREGRAFTDVANDPKQPFDAALDFFNSQDRQRRMVKSETFHNRAPVAAVERELESQPRIKGFLSSADPGLRKRFGEAVTVLVRMIMGRLGWEVV